MCVSVYVCVMYIRKYTHTHIYIYTYTHTHTCKASSAELAGVVVCQVTQVVVSVVTQVEVVSRT